MTTMMLLLPLLSSVHGSMVRIVAESAEEPSAVRFDNDEAIEWARFSATGHQQISTDATLMVSDVVTTSGSSLDALVAINANLSVMVEALQDQIAELEAEHSNAIDMLALNWFYYHGEFQVGNRYSAPFGWGAQTRYGCAQKCLETKNCKAFQIACGGDGCGDSTSCSYAGCTATTKCTTSMCYCWGFDSGSYSGPHDPRGSFESYTLTAMM